MNQSEIRAVAAIANGLASAYMILVNSLKNSGALHPTQVEEGLRGTIEAASPESRDQLDYQMLANILARLEGKRPPPLRVIPGGKSD